MSNIWVNRQKRRSGKIHLKFRFLRCNDDFNRSVSVCAMNQRIEVSASQHLFRTLRASLQEVENSFDPCVPVGGDNKTKTSKLRQHWHVDVKSCKKFKSKNNEQNNTIDQSKSRLRLYWRIFQAKMLERCLRGQKIKPVWKHGKIPVDWLIQCP